MCIRDRLPGGAFDLGALAGFDGVQERDLADGPVDEDVDDGVAIERGDEMLVGGDPPDRLGAGLEDREHP